MQKHWYIVYTKPKCEKKVAALLTKKKIENFCPVNCKQIKSIRRTKVIYDPLFDSYVFVNLAETNINLLSQVDNVLSVLYWKGQAAIIKEEEIDALRKFTNDHHDIKLVRTEVNMNDVVRVVDGPSYSIDGKVLTLKNKTMKVNLPSLGFMMVAEMETETVIGREISFGNKELSLQ